MSQKTVVVVGGVAGGMSFATRYRRLNQNDSIIVLEKGHYVSFANCGLPYHISDEIEDRESLFVAKREMLAQRFQLDVRVNHEVVSIDSLNNSIRVIGPDGEVLIKYDVLVLAVGGKPIILDIDGLETHPSVCTLRNISDMDKILETIKKGVVKDATVIGAGFIGLEVAEALKSLGINVSIIEKSEHVIPSFDKDMAQHAFDTLNRFGVQVFTGKFVNKVRGTTLTLNNGETIESQLVIIAVGIMPATDFLRNSGIVLGTKGEIIVDSYYKTNIDDIYAIGDAILTFNSITNEPAMFALAGPANRQGRHLADNLSGISKPNKGSIGTAILRLFDTTYASTGLNENMLSKYNARTVHIKGNDHAGYFPDAKPILLKVHFDTDSHLILGAQAFGESGVDKRIDVLATAIRNGMKIQDLQDLELSYSPPYGQAKDIINMAGYVGENILLGITETIQWYEIDSLDVHQSILLDVRSQEEYDLGHIKNSINLPLDTLRCSLHELDIHKDVVVYCASGIRSYNAEQILRNAGYSVKNLDGAYGFYEIATKGNLD